MSARRSTAAVRCAESGCEERAFFEYDSQRDRAEAEKRRRDHPWRCTRHTQPGSVMSPESTTRTTVLTATRSDRLPVEHLFWHDGTRLGSGFFHVDGAKAWASDFPEGTTLTVTVVATLPDDAGDPR